MKRSLAHVCLKVAVVGASSIAAVWLSGIVFAAGTATVGVSAPAQAVSTGQQLSVSINVNPNTAIAGAQFSLSFNPSLVSVTGVAEGNLLKQGGANTYFMLGQINNTAGTVSAVAGAITTPGQTVSSSGIFAVIAFTAGTAQGTCPLTLSNVIVGDISGQASTNQPPLLEPDRRQISRCRGAAHLLDLRRRPWRRPAHLLGLQSACGCDLQCLCPRVLLDSGFQPGWHLPQCSFSGVRRFSYCFGRYHYHRDCTCLGTGSRVGEGTPAPVRSEAR